MKPDLSFLDQSIWLCEPVALQRAVARVLAYTTCPTARELVEERRRRLEAARVPLILSDNADTFHPEERAQARPLRGVKGGVGVVHIYGPIEQRVTAELMKAGGTAVEEISASLDALLANKAVDAIVLDVDSPGGTISQVPELADKLRGARGQKRLYASINSLAASAGYWIASAAEQVMITPSGYSGSIGVYMLHTDQSKALEAGGVKITMVSAGKFKTEASPFEPLSEEARGYLQGLVNANYDKFIKALSINRDKSMDEVRRNFGQGRLMNAEDSVANGLANRIMSMEDLLARLAGGSRGNVQDQRTQMMMMRYRHEREKRKSEDMYGVLEKRKKASVAS